MVLRPPKIGQNDEKQNRTANSITSEIVRPLFQILNLSCTYPSYKLWLRWQYFVLVCFGCFHCAWNKSDICVSFMIGLKLLFEWLNVFCYTDNPVFQFSSSFPSCVRFVWSVFGQNIVWQDARKLARFYKLDKISHPKSWILTVLRHVTT